MPSVVGVWRNVAKRLTPVPPSQRQEFRTLPATREAHAEAVAAAPAFGQIELRQSTAADAPDTIRIAAWNLERCLHPEEASRVLQRHDVTLALLTEMDVGVRRTGQVHTIGRVAAQLGQGYCYGLEFLEITPTEPPPGFPRNGDDNIEGYHGNGIVSAYRIDVPLVIRLPEEADWYSPTPGRQRRIGSRMAIAATFGTGDERFVACSVHLENRTDGAGRARQMQTLLDALDAYAGKLPIVIGGDLNTHVGPGGHTDPAEPLFAMARARGYDWAACNLAQPTTRQSIWSESEGTRQLDWFCTRGLAACDPSIVPALGEDATVLTDHELLLLTLRLG